MRVSCALILYNKQLKVTIMRFFRQALIGLTLLTLSLGILAYAGSLIKDALTERFAQEARAPQPRERTFAVNVVTAEPKSITPQLEAFGEIKSRRTLDLRLAIGGQVTELSKNFVDGGQVKLGEKLVELNDADAQSSYLKARRILWMRRQKWRTLQEPYH